jgi:hypothetical protein
MMVVIVMKAMLYNIIMVYTRRCSTHSYTTDYIYKIYINVLDSRCSVLTSLACDSILQPRARMIRETIFDLEFVSDCFPDDRETISWRSKLVNTLHLESNTFI